MNSIQRVLAALTFGRTEHGTPDRVPVFPVPLMQGALVHDCTVEEYFRMPAEKIADAQIALNQMLGGVPDAVAGIPNVIQDVTGFGLGLDYHYANSTPAVNGMLIRDFADIDTLRTPDPQQSPELVKTLELISNLRSRIGGEKVVLGACIAPFSLPSMLMGTSKWMRLLFTPSLRERYMKRILDVCESYVARWSALQVQAGAHVVVLADGMASASMLPESMFKRHALPVIKRAIAAVPGMAAYEAVGRVEPFVDYFRDLGAVALLLGEEDDIATCKRRLGNRLGLIGNVNNMKLRRWSPARAEMKAKQALRDGMEGYGFILANQGPELPFDVSVDNIQSLVNCVEKFGRYDKDKSPRSRRTEPALAC
ncbi:MAG: uroporphyrinogen decarboxylase family protein [Planctomycetales bacterium]|nr:uroporphyrinogen decarboxylase family protein [Planctomycetales bacterium]